ncbi:protein NETWORKED 3C-like [Panicum miliaceum]|uniref:Protein NETWORKED 3C-like n=1 Tax=Panicum miliaceum TaxID=4540 RepID=A0A3L6QUC5_PANMI|nr:protein NETWORKED 3C-like [Panicum miliaceum]
MGCLAGMNTTRLFQYNSDIDCETGKSEDKMMRKELPQAWWFGSHNLTRPSPWLNNTLSELDDKTMQMLKLIDQDADSFAQRAEMYYKKRPVLVDMLGDLYRTHRSLAEQYDLLKHGSGTRQTVFGLSSCTQSRSQASSTNGRTTPRSSCSISIYDSESEVDDPEQEDEEQQEQLMRGEIIKMESASQEQQRQKEQVELMRVEIESLKEQNAALQKAVEENAALKAELAGKDEEKREVIRQLASSMDMMREENLTLREHIRGSKHSSTRAFDLKKVAKDLFSARLFTAHCKPTGPIVAL